MLLSVSALMYLALVTRSNDAVDLVAELRIEASDIQVLV